jgi:hypothetical protein
MSIQFVTNDKGERLSVLIPYQEWDALKKEHDELKHRLQEVELALCYKNAFKEARLFEQGKLETFPIAGLFDEL